jgi:hypothetical protein
MLMLDFSVADTVSMFLRIAHFPTEAASSSICDNLNIMYYVLLCIYSFEILEAVSMRRVLRKPDADAEAEGRCRHHSRLAAEESAPLQKQIVQVVQVIFQDFPAAFQESLGPWDTTTCTQKVKCH